MTLRSYSPSPRSRHRSQQYTSRMLTIFFTHSGNRICGNGKDRVWRLIQDSISRISKYRYQNIGNVNTYKAVGSEDSDKQSYQNQHVIFHDIIRQIADQYTGSNGKQKTCNENQYCIVSAKFKDSKGGTRYQQQNYPRCISRKSGKSPLYLQLSAT